MSFIFGLKCRHAFHILDLLLRDSALSVFIRYCSEIDLALALRSDVGCAAREVVTCLGHVEHRGGLLLVFGREERGGVPLFQGLAAD